MHSYLRSEMFMRAVMDRVDLSQIVFWLLVMGVILSAALATTGIAWAVNSLVERRVEADGDWSRQPKQKKRPHSWTPIPHA